MLHDLDYNRPVFLIGNGPSSRSASISKFVGTEYYVARTNFFFLEDEQRYGNHVDFYFWGLNNPALHDELLKHVALESSPYRVDNFFCPVPKVELRYTGGLVDTDPFYHDRPPFDHWLMIGNQPRLSRYMMSRPLPTMGLQALATLTSMGFRKFYVSGIDFYSDAEQRYAYDVPDEVRAKMDKKHFKPGYEAGAHSLALDLDFLQAITNSFPDLEIHSLSHMPILEDVLSRRDPPKNYSNPSPLTELASFSNNNSVGDQVTRTEGLLLNTEVVPPAHSDQVIDSAHIRIMRETIARYEGLVEKLSNKLNSAEELAAISELTARVQLNEQAMGALVSNASPFSGTVFLVHDMTSYAGVYRPLKCFKDYIEEANLDRLRFINVSKLRVPISGAMQVLTKMSCRRVVANSIAVFRFPHTESFMQNAKETYIYLHETAWTIDLFKIDHPEAYNKFIKAMETSTVLCVSKVQESYVKSTFKVKKTIVVYNTSENILPPIERKTVLSSPAARLKASKLKKDALLIGMVGSIQARKGVNLFSAVARLFKETQIPARFVWIGNGDRDIFKGTPVEAPGPKAGPEVKQFLRNCDVLLVPSNDDPFPLAPLEALAFGVRVVCYEQIGTSELIRGIRGCATFADYTPESAFNAMVDALEKELDFSLVHKRLRATCDIDTFANAICKAIGVSQQWSHTNSPDALTTPIFTVLLAAQRQTIAQSVSALEVEDPELASDVLLIRAKSNPRDFDAVMAAVKFFMERGNARNCLEILKQAISARPDRPSLKRELALAHLACGELQEALDWAKTALSENPSSDAARKLVDRISEQVDLRSSEAPSPTTVTSDLDHIETTKPQIDVTVSG